MTYLLLHLAEDIVGEPAEDWPGRCFEIASKIAPKIGGKPLYGLYLGPIAEGSYFDARRAVGFCRHGWIEMPGGEVVDPTRWVFEGVDPYIYQGPADYYDLGGSTLMRVARHLRGDDPGEPLEKPLVFGDERVAKAVRGLLGGRDPEGFNDLWRLAHTTPYILGPEAGPSVYRAIRAVGRGALIPIDFQRYYEEDGSLEEETDDE